SVPAGGGAAVFLVSPVADGAPVAAHTGRLRTRPRRPRDNTESTRRARPLSQHAFSTRFDGRKSRTAGSQHDRPLGRGAGFCNFPFSADSGSRGGAATRER